MIYFWSGENYEVRPFQCLALILLNPAGIESASGSIILKDSISSLRRARSWRDFRTFSKKGS
jgi:hypothetical protein